MATLDGIGNSVADTPRGKSDDTEGLAEAALCED